MSAPQTNLEKQERRHWGPLTGIALGLAFVVVLFVGWLIWETANGQNPREATPEGGVIGTEQSSDTAISDTGAPAADVVTAPLATETEVQN